jgi:hypothetical protein
VINPHTRANRFAARVVGNEARKPFAVGGLTIRQSLIQRRIRRAQGRNVDQGVIAPDTASVPRARTVRITLGHRALQSP